MKKGKFLTALLACSMSVVAATACSFAVGCKKDKGGDGEGEGGHTHTYATTWSKDANKHWHDCTANDGAKDGSADHVWDGNTDTDCNVCGYVRTVTPENPGPENPGPENPGPEGPGTQTKAPVVVNASSLSVGNLSDGQTLGTGVKVYGAPAVDANSKTIHVKGETVSISNRIKLSSKATNKDTPMAIEVTADEAATLVVYYYAGSANNTRGIELYEKGADDKLTVIANTTEALSDGNVMATYMHSLEANKTYYVGASVAGVNVYYLSVVYGDVGETWEDHEAKAAECEVKGNIAYSVSNYDRYKKADGTYIMSNAYSLDALVHSYTLKAGSIVTPTDDPDTNPGKATLTCANGHDTDVLLPVLSSDKYTARPAAGATGTYTITLNGVAISFEATGVAEQETTYTDVYKLDGAAIALLDNSVTEKTAGQNCVYRKCYTSGSNSYSGSMDPTNAKGLQVGDSSNRTDVRIALGTPISSGVVKISGAIEAGGNNSKWRFFQLHGSAEPDKETLSFGTNADKKIQCYSAVDTDYVGTGAAAAYSANTAINFEIIIDFTTKKVTVKLDNTVYLENYTYGADDLSEIGLNVNNGRSVILHNVTIATQD
ncbi:MAG: hypothetical protein K2K60_00590 [Clostridia bacterium]|nr:hypothetical protein [Clostridia bacterium]